MAGRKKIAGQKASPLRGQGKDNFPKGNPVFRRSPNTFNNHMKIISVVGARPNFMKIAPFIRAINDYNNNAKSPSISPSSPQHSSVPHPSFPTSLHHILVHTGQHYDDKMSMAFFDALGIPEAEINLGVGSGTHAELVGQTMMEFEKVLRSEKPDWVV